MQELYNCKVASNILKVSLRSILWVLHGFQFDVLKIGAGMTSRYPIPSKTLVESIQRKGRN